MGLKIIYNLLDSMKEDKSLKRLHCEQVVNITDLVLVIRNETIDKINWNPSVGMLKGFCQSVH